MEDLCEGKVSEPAGGHNRGLQPVHLEKGLLDLFGNPIGFPHKSRKMTNQRLAILLFLSGSCSETEVSEQLYYNTETADNERTGLRIIYVYKTIFFHNPILNYRHFFAFQSRFAFNANS